MSNKWRAGLAVAAAVLAATALASVQVRNARSVAGSADFSGTWTLDVSRSDFSGGPGGRGRFERGAGRGGDDGAGRWRGRGGDGEPDGEAGRPRRGGRRMPSILEVTQRDGAVSFADSAGAVFQIVRIEGAASPEPGEARRELTGRWENGTLMAEATGPRGGTVVRRYTLLDSGRTLEIRTERKTGSRADGPRRFGRGEVKLVYRRAS